MEPLYFQSEDALYAYLKRFITQKLTAKVLGKSAENKVCIVFQYSVDGRQYKLLGGTTRAAIEKFIELSEEQGSPSMALREYEDSKKGPCLILGHQKKPTQGWQCALYKIKSSDQLKRAA